MGTDFQPNSTGTYYEFNDYTCMHEKLLYVEHFPASSKWLLSNFARNRYFVLVKKLFCILRIEHFYVFFFPFSLSALSAFMYFMKILRTVVLRQLFLCCQVQPSTSKVLS